MLRNLFVLRMRRVCYSFDSVFDLLPPNNGGWFFDTVMPASGTGLFEPGDWVMIAPTGATTAVVSIVRKTTIVASVPVTASMPSGKVYAHWLQGMLGKNLFFVYRDLERPIGGGQSRARMHVEVIDPTGANKTHIPWIDGNITEFVEPAAEEGERAYELQVVDLIKGFMAKGTLQQDDEGSGEEPIP